MCSRMVRTEQRALLYTTGSSDPNHICGHYRAIEVERKMASMDACLSSSKASARLLPLGELADPILANACLRPGKDRPKHDGST